MPCFAALGDIAIDMKEPAIQSTIGEQSADPLIIPGLDDPSYILYTSGELLLFPCGLAVLTLFKEPPARPKAAY